MMNASSKNDLQFSVWLLIFFVHCILSDFQLLYEKNPTWSATCFSSFSFAFVGLGAKSDAFGSGNNFLASNINQLAQLVIITKQQQKSMRISFYIEFFAGATAVHTSYIDANILREFAHTSRV